MRKLLLLVSLVFVGSVQAELINRGGGLIYDTELDVTWLQDTNYQLTSGYVEDRAMTWYQAMTWTEGLSYYDSVRDVTYDDWRLPNADINNDQNFVWCQNEGVSDAECRDNEYSYMYWKNGITEDNHGPFIGFSGSFYWALNTWVGPTNPAAYIYRFAYGGHTYGYKSTYGLLSWAVRDGDVDTIGSPINVQLDFEPWDSTNYVDPTADGLLTIALFTTSTGNGDAVDFDVNDVHLPSVNLGVGQAKIVSAVPFIIDADNDGDTDMIVQFNAQDAAILCGDTSIELLGETYTRQQFAATSSLDTGEDCETGCHP